MTRIGKITVLTLFAFFCAGFLCATSYAQNLIDTPRLPQSTNLSDCESALLRAKTLESENQFAGAIELYQFVIQQAEGTELANLAQLRLAYLYIHTHSTEDLQCAQALLNEYVQLPKSQTARDEASYQLAWVHHDLGYQQESSDRFKKLIEEYPDSKYVPDAMYRLAHIYAKNQKPDSAMKILDSLLSETGLSKKLLARSIYLRGDLCFRTNQWKQCIVSMNRLSEMIGLQNNINLLDPSLQPWVQLRIAQSLGQLQEWKQAERVAESAKLQFPTFDSLHEFEFVCGRAMEDQGRLTDARIRYQAVVDMAGQADSSSAAMAQWRIGETFFHQENFHEAIKAYGKVVASFESPIWSSAALLQAGKCQENLGNWKHAEKLYSCLLEKHPDSPHVVAARNRRQQIVRLANTTSATESK